MKIIVTGQRNVVSSWLKSHAERGYEVEAIKDAERATLVLRKVENEP